MGGRVPATYEAVHTSVRRDRTAIKRTQSCTECTQSFTENADCTSRKTLARTASMDLLCETLGALCETLCPLDCFVEPRRMGVEADMRIRLTWRNAARYSTASMRAPP